MAGGVVGATVGSAVGAGLQQVLLLGLQVPEAEIIPTLLHEGTPRQLPVQVFTGGVVGAAVGTGAQHEYPFVGQVPEAETSPAVLQDTPRHVPLQGMGVGVGVA